MFSSQTIPSLGFSIHLCLSSLSRSSQQHGKVTEATRSSHLPFISSSATPTVDFSRNKQAATMQQPWNSGGKRPWRWLGANYASTALAPPPNLRGSLTIIDERTGQRYQVQVSDEGIGLSDIPEFDNSAGDLSFLEQDESTPTVYLNRLPNYSSSPNSRKPYASNSSPGLAAADSSQSNASASLFTFSLVVSSGEPTVTSNTGDLGSEQLQHWRSRASNPVCDGRSIADGIRAEASRRRWAKQCSNIPHSGHPLSSHRSSSPIAAAADDLGLCLSIDVTTSRAAMVVTASVRDRRWVPAKRRVAWQQLAEP
nr:citrate synthase, glyoxysomal-like [Ipomoea batatas]